MQVDESAPTTTATTVPSAEEQAAITAPTTVTTNGEQPAATTEVTADEKPITTQPSQPPKELTEVCLTLEAFFRHSFRNGRN